MAGARFDDDWSVHLWTAAARCTSRRSEQPETPTEPAASRRRFALPRLRLPSPAAAVALVGLALLGGALGTFLTAAARSRRDGARSRHSRPAGETADGEALARLRARTHRGAPGGVRAGRAAGPPAPAGLGTKTRELAMKPPPETTESRTGEAPAAEADDATPQPATPPGAEQDRLRRRPPQLPQQEGHGPLLGVG